MLYIDKEFLRFLIYTQIKRKVLVIKCEINYEKEFLDKNQGIDSNRITEKKKLIKEYDNELFRLAKKFYEIAKQDISKINEVILEQWKKAKEYLIANPNNCDIDIYTLINYCGLCNDEEFLTLYKIYYNETLEKGKTDTHRRFTFYNNIAIFVRWKEYDFIPILIDIVNFKLYNPNLSTGASREPFWTCFPNPFALNELSLLSYKEKVVLDERTNYYILNNGSDAVKTLLPPSPMYNGVRTLSKEKKFDLKLFSKIIKERNFSVLDTVRLTSENSPFYSNNNRSLLEFLFEDYQSEYKTIKDIKDYLLSKKGINEQIRGAFYREPFRNDVIDMYIDLITKVNDEELEKEKKKLQFLKF